MKPTSDLTTPRTLMWPISRHFFPVEQPDPPACCTTGLKNGSRLPFMAHFFSSGGACFEASVLTSSAGFRATAGLTSGVAAIFTFFGALDFGCAAAATLTETFFPAPAVFAAGFDMAEAGGAGAAAGLTAAFAGRTVGAGVCPVGFAVGWPAAGFAGTPAASSAALLSLACFCCSDFATLRALSMASGFCAHAAPAITAIAKMLVVSFIAIPTCSSQRLWFRFWLQRPPLQHSNRD